MIIVLDLDDTLLNSNLQVSSYSLQILKKLQAKGHKIMVSTLRSLVRCKDYARQINADYVSCFLGNLLLDGQGKILKNDCLKFNDFSQIISDFKSVYDCWIGFETDDISVIGCEEVAKKYDGVTYLEESKILPRLNTSNVFKISFSCKDDAEIIEKYKDLASKYGCSYKFSRGFRYCDLIPKGTDKVNALRYVKKLNPRQKMIAFGDDKSDAESIKFATIGICMQNGLDEVKLVADKIALSNDEDGVARFLEAEFLQKLKI